MKYWIRGIVLGAFCAGAWAGEGYRDFTNTKGQTVRGRVASFDANKDIVQIESEKGKKARVPLSALIEADQQYIKEWAAAHAFLSERTLKVECEDRQVKKWKEEETRSITYTSGSVEENFCFNIIKYEQTAYDFTFENRGAMPIQGLRLEYCIYYDQSAMSRGGAPVVESKILFGKTGLPEIAAKKTVTVSTEPVTIYEDDINPVPQAGGDQRRPGRGEIVGIRARLIFKNGAEEAVREICDPNWLTEEDYPWTDRSSASQRKTSFSW